MNLNHYYIILVLNIYLVSLVGALISFREANEELRNALQHDRPCNFLLDFKDAHLLTPGIVEKYGYPVERHWVTTEDGYILEIHRIPAKTGASPAVLLMHGVVSSSRDFVINCDRRALAFQLWENGFDVFLGNYRGNTYSRNHTTLSESDSQFWDFSIDEIGYYDGPAMVDYILNITNLKQLSYVGYSMGNGVALIMLTTRPEYNEKVNIWFAMSASVTLQDTSSPLLRIFAAFPRTVEWVLRRYNHGKFFPEEFLKFMSRYFPIACRREGRTGNLHGICSVVFYINDGYDPGQVSPELWSVVMGEFPTSTSVRFIVQWMQWIISGNFSMYDEGPIKNLKKYGSIAPPKFPAEKLTTPTVIMYGENDWVVSASDVRKMKVVLDKMVRKLGLSSLPIEYFKISSPHWNHGDFIYGKDADIFVYGHILKRLDTVYRSAGNNNIGDSGNNITSLRIP